MRQDVKRKKAGRLCQLVFLFQILDASNSILYILVEDALILWAALFAAKVMTASFLIVAATKYSPTEAPTIARMAYMGHPHLYPHLLRVRAYTRI